MAAPKLIIAGIELPIRARLDYQQTFDPIGARNARRHQDGSLFVTGIWKKWKTTITGGGWIPAQLLGINYDAPYEIHCIQPMAFAVGEALPPGWAARVDVPEELITDEHSISTRLIYPILTVMSERPKITPGENPSWVLECEEI